MWLDLIAYTQTVTSTETKQRLIWKTNEKKGNQPGIYYIIVLKKRVKTTIVLYLYILIHDDFRIYTRIEHFFGMLPRMAKLKKRHFCIYMRFSASLSFSP